MKFRTCIHSCLMALALTILVLPADMSTSQTSRASAQEQADIGPCGLGVSSEVITACLNDPTSTLPLNCTTFPGLSLNQQLQVAINHVASTNFGGTVFIPGGVYPIFTPLIVPTGGPVVIRGNGASVGFGLSPSPTVLSASGGIDVIMTDTGVSNLMVVDLKIDGNQSADEGIRLNWTQNALLTCLIIVETTGETVKMFGGASMIDNTISNSFLQGGGGLTATMTETGTRTTISGNQLQGDLSAISSDGDDGLIFGNVVHATGSGSANVAIDLQSPGPNGMMVLNNSISSGNAAGSHGITVSGNGHRIVQNLIFWNETGVQIFGNASNIVLDDNNIENCSERCVQIDSGATMQSLSLNHIANAGQEGLWIESISNLTMTGNTFSCNNAAGSPSSLATMFVGQGSGNVVQGGSVLHADVDNDGDVDAADAFSAVGTTIDPSVQFDQNSCF